MTTTQTREKRKPGRKAEREKARIVAAVTTYLEAAESDATLSLVYDAIETATGVSRRHLSNTDDEDYAALVARIHTLRLKRAGQDTGGEAHTGVGDSPLADATLSDAALAGCAEERVGEIGRMMREWLSRHGSSPNAAMAGLALHDVDVLLGHLYHEATGLRPLVREMTRRQDIAHAAAREAAGLGAGRSLDPQLTLDGSVREGGDDPPP